MPNHQAALRYIAVFKFIKAISLVLVAVVAFGFVRTPRLEQAAGWIRALPIQTGRALLLRGAEALLNAKPRRLELIGAAALFYAAVFTVEGVGLWRKQRWGEYVTVIVTGSLIPFELWEIVHRISALKVVGLAVNVAIVIYLWRGARSTSPRATPPRAR